MTLRLDKPFYSPAEVANLAGLHSSTILNYIRDGKLYAVKLSERTYRIPLRSVLKLLDPESVPPPTVVERPDAEVKIADADREPDFVDA
ncbi:MAG: helix-turn-helix domain-containing protein [Candidatus Limnocylindria bacterium]